MGVAVRRDCRKNDRDKIFIYQTLKMLLRRTMLRGPRRRNGMKMKLCKASLMLIAMQALTIPVVFDIVGVVTKGVFGVIVLALLSVHGAA
jgi:hypothetical protein